jgi:hypothetical protein
LVVPVEHEIAIQQPVEDIDELVPVEDIDEPTPVEDIDEPVVEHGMPLPIVDGNGLAIVDGNGLGVGTTGAALTPALPISVEPNGIPIRAAPPDGVATDDGVLVLALVPHAPVAALPGKDAPVPIVIPPPS